MKRYTMWIVVDEYGKPLVVSKNERGGALWYGARVAGVPLFSSLKRAREAIRKTKALGLEWTKELVLRPMRAYWW